MQGRDTDKSIIQALEKINKNIERFDLVVIIRGGGSKSDLSAFDSYEIAMNISQFPLPVITGIGHERDESITDLVACISLKTPTAVADFLIHKLREVLNYLNKTSELFFLKSNELLAEKKSEFERLKLNFRYSTQEKVEKIRNELEQKMNRIKLFSRNVIGKNRLLIQQYDSVLSQSIKFYISEKKHENDGFSLKIRNAVKTYLLKQKQLNEIYGQKAEFLNPNNILKRGYSITLHQGKPVKSIKQIKPDDVIETKLIDGKFRSIVKN
jgi:exodeoxyribonuclease VII large subunit